MLAEGHLERVVPGRNGVFRATIVHGGRVIGTWSRKLKKAAMDVEAAPFGKTTRVERAAFEQAAARYGRFLGRAVTVRWP